MKGKMHSKFIKGISIFFFIDLILPNYFAIEFSESLPLLTASRGLLLLLIPIVMIKTKGKLKRGLIDKNYFIFIEILLFVNIYNISYSMIPSINMVISLILEYYLFSFLIVSYVDTEEKINDALIAMVYASIVVGILGAVETFTGVNVFYFLTTTRREMLQSSYLRFGLVRASGPFGHSVYFGNYSVCMIPFSLYLYDIKKKPVFFIAFIINVLSVILSGSRASVVVLFGVSIYIIIKKRGQDTKKYFRNFLFFIPVVVMMFVIYPKSFRIMLSVIEASLEAFTVSSTERSNSILGNASPILSRIEQFSGIVWTIQNKKTIFGFGHNAHMEGLIYYMTDGIWYKRKTFDVGYVAIFCQYGIIGIIAYFILYWSRLKKISEYKKRLKNINSTYSVQTSRLLNLQTTFQIFYVCYLVHLFSSVGVERMLVIAISLQMATNRICDKILQGKIKDSL